MLLRVNFIREIFIIINLKAPISFYAKYYIHHNTQFVSTVHSIEATHCLM